MADVNWSDDEDVIGFFNDNSDQENDFEGFINDERDIGHRNVLTVLPMTDFVPNNDRDFGADQEEGWSRVDTPLMNAPFTGEEKLNVDMPDYKPLSFLKLFVSDAFLETVVQQTNLYAERRVQSDDVSHSSRLKKWSPVILAEIKTFLALVIIMGLEQKRDVQDYWAKEDTLETPFIR